MLSFASLCQTSIRQRFTGICDRQHSGPVVGSDHVEVNILRLAWNETGDLIELLGILSFWYASQLFDLREHLAAGSNLPCSVYSLDIEESLASILPSEAEK